MSDIKDIDYYRKLKYDIRLRRTEKKFVLFIPELNVAEEDDNLGQAYQKLELEKEKYFQEMIENEYQDYIEEPKESKSHEPLLKRFLPFFVMLAIIFIIIVIAGVTASPFYKARMNEMWFENQISEIAPHIASELLNTIDNIPEEQLVALKQLYQDITKKSDSSKQIYSDDSQVQIEDSDENYKLIKTFEVPSSGPVIVKWSGYIQDGKYYWAWKIAKNGGQLLKLAGTNIDAAKLYSQNRSTHNGLHEYNDYSVDVGGLKVGDTLEIWMASTNIKGDLVKGDGQVLYAKNFKLYPTFGLGKLVGKGQKNKDDIKANRDKLEKILLLLQKIEEKENLGQALKSIKE